MTDEIIDAGHQPIFFIEIITLVPEIWPELLGRSSGLVGRAFSEGLVESRINNLREFGKGVHQQVDDAPFGGGVGMVLMAPPVCAAIDLARSRTPGPVIYLTPHGKRLNQGIVRELALGHGMSLLCGRYEGIDQRIETHVDLELCLADVVLSAGDPAAWAVIDAVVRLLPGVLGNVASVIDESFSQSGGLEYPQYTRPIEFEAYKVPDILRSGDHAAIAAWRRHRATWLTRRLRFDLVEDD